MDKSRLLSQAMCGAGRPGGRGVLRRFQVVERSTPPTPVIPVRRLELCVCRILGDAEERVESLVLLLEGAEGISKVWL